MQVWFILYIWYETAFRITGTVYGESTEHQWIPLTKDQWVGALIIFVMFAQTSCWINIKVAGEFKYHDGMMSL